jgi:uncharacterized membrane protein
MRDAASLLTLVAFVFLAAAYGPRDHIKTRFDHPLVLGVKAWALAHLHAFPFWRNIVVIGARRFPVRVT